MDLERQSSSKPGKSSAFHGLLFGGLIGAAVAGLALAIGPFIGSELGDNRLVLNIAGGPLASLLLAIFAVAAIAYVEPRLAAYCLTVAATSFGIFLVTLIPVRAGGFMSDGMQLIDVWRGGTAVVERSALLESGVDGYPSGFRQAVHVELAIGAWLAGDTDAVRRHLAAGNGGIVEKSRRLLAQAALARLEGRDGDCERARLLALKALAKASDAGQQKLTEDQLAMLAPKIC